MDNFLEYIRKELGNESEDIEKVLEFLNDKYDDSGLYTREFATTIATQIHENRLDKSSMIIGLIYPAYKVNPNVIDKLQISDEIREIFRRLAKIENLNLSTHQDQLDNIKNMFIALAKDFRVIIIKLCIEVSKLKFLDTLSNEYIEKYMQEVTDIYLPICQMLGLSQIKNAFGNATFKYYKPAMYEELTDALNMYME